MPRTTSGKEEGDSSLRRSGKSLGFPSRPKKPPDLLSGRRSVVSKDLHLEVDPRLNQAPDSGVLSHQKLSEGGIVDVKGWYYIRREVNVKAHQVAKAGITLNDTLIIQQGN
ncbi:hypothetical protein Cni_G01982 [Canna indica]|uniref:Uncharacterized protein n=1 Tax=Canna indica TaxID=4628 RepID=A0AAQ3JQ64_9LILI|nr:hypothetical protein Cni_G01982 [Canna indica]